MDSVTSQETLLRNFVDFTIGSRRGEVDDATIVANLWESARIKNREKIYPADVIFILACELMKEGINTAEDLWLKRSTIDAHRAEIFEAYRTCVDKTEEKNTISLGFALLIQSAVIIRVGESLKKSKDEKTTLLVDKINATFQIGINLGEPDSEGRNTLKAIGLIAGKSFHAHHLESHKRHSSHMVKKVEEIFSSLLNP